MIPIRHEKEVDPDFAFMPAENCAMCGMATRYWNFLRDVACCPDCAKAYKVADLPTKRAWCDAVSHASKTRTPYVRPPAGNTNRRVL